MKHVSSLACIALIALAGCPKPAPPQDADASAVTATSATALAAGDGGGGAAKDGGAATARAGEPSSWTVKYTLAAATLYIPTDKDWSHTKFKNDEEKYLGDGTLTLAVDPSGRVSGTSDGPPLGAAILDGVVEAGKLSATIRRKDPADNGLTGTMVGTIAGDKLDGSMKLAEANAAVVREGKLTATKK